MPISAATQTEHAQRSLRQLIADGHLAAGQRVTELAMVDRLGVSRTPVRAALAALEGEGLLQALQHGGYVVREFSEGDMTDAIELRGTLEGLLARLAAERGAAADLLSRAREVLDAIDVVLAAPTLNEARLDDYVTLNGRFHQLLADMPSSPLLARECARVASLPFASPSAFVGVQVNARRSRDMLVVAQDQHRQVLAAIEDGEGTRAEALMREHAKLAQRNLQTVLKSGLHPPSPGSDAKGVLAAELLAHGLVRP